MTEERKPLPERPLRAQPAARELKVRTEPPPRKEEVVQREAAKLADKVGANA